jgi:hypothetical protein
LSLFAHDCVFSTGCAAAAIAKMKSRMDFFMVCGRKMDETHALYIEV